MLSRLVAGRMLRLRCKTKNGSHIMQGLTHQSCVQELKTKVEELTGIPCDVQKIMVGYPPSSLDLRNGDAHLKDYPIKSGMLSNTQNTETMNQIHTNYSLYKYFIVPTSSIMSGLKGNPGIFQHGSYFHTFLI